ncbi:D-2-hydroxyacid dehydrogenase (plasmid) [Thioclava sp. 'Guangxiensis']|uniref:D-2-hydroxyacid dehydrogenase n=1 Tax=Thioclava sp. 'Guangxiensis' TaxID=3149044 RepID=UPI0032C3F8AC
MTRIVFLDRATIAPQITVPRPVGDVDWVQYDRTRPEEVTSRLAGAMIAITNKVRITAEVLAACPELKLVAIAATGFDCVDLEAARARGVTVCNIRGYSVNTVPEHVMALLLALRRNLIPYARDVGAGRWQESGQFCFFDHPIQDLAGSTMGIVGRGQIGQKVAMLARAFGMEVCFAARPGQVAQDERIGFDEMLERADVISLHCPLTPETRGLLGPDAFAKMARKPVILNTGRGGLIDLAALSGALEAGRISGAGIDVADQEPPPADDLLMQLAKDPRVIVTPHVAWASEAAQSALAAQLCQVIEGFMEGKPLNVLT